MICFPPPPPQYCLNQLLEDNINAILRHENIQKKNSNYSYRPILHQILCHIKQLVQDADKYIFVQILHNKSVCDYEMSNVYIYFMSFFPRHYIGLFFRLVVETDVAKFYPTLQNVLNINYGFERLFYFKYQFMFIYKE